MVVTPTAVPKDKRWSVTQLLMLENVSGSETHASMCVVYGAQNVIKKLAVNQYVYRFKVGQRVQATNLKVVDHGKEGPGVVCDRHQETHRSIWKMSR